MTKIRRYADKKLDWILREQTRVYIFSTKAGVFARWENCITKNEHGNIQGILLGDVPLTHCSVYVFWHLMQCAE